MPDKTEILLMLVIVGLLAERMYLARHVGAALGEIKNLQAELFKALEKSYHRVSHSHSMVMRVMNVVDKTLGIDPAPEEDDETMRQQKKEWPDLVVPRDEQDE